jgi:hypothetical protein
MPLSISISNTPLPTLSMSDIQHNNTASNVIMLCLVIFVMLHVVMLLSVIILSVIMLSVILLSVIMLSVIC